jgi:hypothetical protein
MQAYPAASVMVDWEAKTYEDDIMNTNTRAAILATFIFPVFDLMDNIQCFLLSKIIERRGTL